MANIGLLKPYYANYAENDGTVTYSNGGRIAKAISVDLALDNTDPVILYADDGPAETVSAFSGGTLTLGIDELSIATAGALLGLTPSEDTTSGGSVLEFPDSNTAPYVGVGFIVRKMVNNVQKFMAVILTKCKFNIPEEAYQTMGETIEFQTPELTATVLRDDTNKHNWKIWNLCADEASAEAWIKSKLAI